MIPKRVSSRSRLQFPEMVYDVKSLKLSGFLPVSISLFIQLSSCRTLAFPPAFVVPSISTRAFFPVMLEGDIRIVSVVFVVDYVLKLKPAECKSDGLLQGKICGI